MIPLRGMFLALLLKFYFLLLRSLRSLRSILGTALLAILNTRGIQCSAHDVVAHSWEILHAAAAHQHDRVLLQVVPDARNIGGHFHRVGQTHARHFAQRGVWLLR